jgi:hypothetical protein
MPAWTVFCRFTSSEGDLMTLLEVVSQYAQVPPKRKAEWCRDNFLNAKGLAKVKKLGLLHAASLRRHREG